MNLNKKKSLAARTLGIGKERIIFNVERLEEIKEAITKQDIRDLVAAGAILIREVKGRKVLVSRKLRRGPGKVRKKVVDSKRVYMTLTRKLRSYLADLKEKKTLGNEEYQKLRKEIRASAFKSLTHMKERMKEMKEQ